MRELRLIEDFLTDRGALSLPALPRMLYVVRGTLRIGERILGAGETFFSEGPISAETGGMGAILWRWELSDPHQPVAKATPPSAASHTKLVAPLAALADGELLWRGDSVAFPPGGCAYLHRHQGPGIRCLVEGSLRIDTAGQSHTYEIGDAWFESGPDPVLAQAGSRPARFIRVLILPRALIGKSSIQYVNEEDKDKPKTQQYRVFVDAPLSRP